MPSNNNSDSWDNFKFPDMSHRGTSDPYSDFYDSLETEWAPDIIGVPYVDVEACMHIEAEIDWNPTDITGLVDPPRRKRE